ncbi:acyl-CoA/acyl-ACP dehydrogenase [Hyphomonas sp. WL0036]|uniref:acyl-CoA dehydrogenase family protein n=1 Tax=Hyphomonas sediminis TaxID=2866160 RepID=UPI001C80E3B2|nr:acyl-CoA dehydrogenase family protein [Hyphomonas sediminis]MBY9068151.1 acyl-CoA/acyl-ACP dehydrogenase [Hyphomonas sediminis]
MTANPVDADLAGELSASVQRLCAAFPAEYWRNADASHRFPVEFREAVAAGGFLGVAMPEQYGGSGLGIREAALILKAIAASGAGASGTSAVHMNIFGLHPIVVAGTEDQKSRFLPPIISGEHHACFAVTEPNSGLDAGRLETRAERRGDRYVITGRKIWISTAQIATHMLIVARTGGAGLSGLTLFYSPLDRNKVEIREIDKMGRAAVDSNMLFIEGLEVPVENRIGEEGDGFKILLHGLNPERILAAAGCVGIGLAALERASAYARERVVFGRQIGSNQGVSHPLAEAWAKLEAADALVARAAALYDSGRPCGPQANAAKYLAAEASFEACEAAVLTLGGMGYAKEYDVERLFRESMIGRIAPVSRQMIFNFISEKVLDLPRSY